MPKVDLIATKDFGYNTRRLKAKEPFQARNAVEAMILTKVRKVAEVPAPKPARKAPEAPVEAKEAAPTPAEAPAPKKAPAKRKAKARK